MPDEEKKTEAVETVEVKVEIKYNTRPVEGQPRVFQPVKVNDPYMANLKVKVNEDGTISPDESDLVNLDEVSQTYRDQCGMEMAKRLIKLGQIDPQSLADDGKHSYDGSKVPEGRQAIDNAAIAAGKQVDAAKEEFGIPDGAISDEQLDALIGKYIEKHLDKYVQPKPAGGNE